MVFITTCLFDHCFFRTLVSLDKSLENIILSLRSSYRYNYQCHYKKKGYNYQCIKMDFEISAYFFGSLFIEG